MKIKNFKALLLLSNLLIFLSSTVLALPINWHGPYLGIQAGKAWNRTNWNFNNANYFNTAGPVLLGNNFNLSSNEYQGGVDLGFNYQMDYWIVGLEGELMGINLNSSITSPFFATDVYTSKLNWYATLKARVGYIYDCWLGYVSAGWGGADTSLNLLDTVAGVEAHSNQWAPGWTVGVGIDYRLTNNLTLGAAYEYLRFNVRNKNIGCPTCGTGIGGGTPNVDGVFKTNSVVARLNYLFF